MEKSNIWEKYEKAKDYIDRKGLIGKTDINWRMYSGDQWLGKLKDVPMLNFIKPIVKYKVATIAQHSMVANYSDAQSKASNQAIYRKFNELFSQSWEKGKMDSIAWGVVKRGAVQGDSYVFWGNGDTNKKPQIIMNTNIMFGDENIKDIQSQPYIIIEERLTVAEVKRRAKENGISKDKIESITADQNTTRQIMNKDEVGGKITSILYMEKIDGVVNVARATENLIYEELHPLNNTKNGIKIGGLTSYPIVGFIWEEKPNSARGIGEVEPLIANQVEYNKTLARRSETVKLTAFPRIAYDATAIENPDDLDKVGTAISVNGGGSQSINQMISYLSTANISPDAQNLSQDLLVNSRELAGAGDLATGNVNPERTSGVAIIAIRDQAQVPLNEQVRNYQQFVEDVAILWLDLWTTYTSNKFIVTDITTDGEEQERTVSYKELKELKPTVRIDVSQDNKWTKLAEQQTADNLLAGGHITFEEYVTICPENGNIPKGKLLKILKDREEKRQELPLNGESDENNEDEEAPDFPQKPSYNGQNPAINIK